MSLHLLSRIVFITLTVSLSPTPAPPTEQQKVESVICSVCETVPLLIGLLCSGQPSCVRASANNSPSILILRQAESEWNKRAMAL